MKNDIWIVSAKRTPIGRFQGQLQTLSAPALGRLLQSVSVVEKRPQWVSKYHFKN